jgi:hypothetical protein
MSDAWKSTYQVIDSDTLRLAENAPMVNPVVSMGVSSLLPFNNLLGKTFQFAYQWEYKDFRRSILSPYSEICVSKDLFSSQSSPIGDEENYVRILFSKGNTEVSKVILLCSENNSGNWFIIYEYNKTEDDINTEVILENTSTTLSVSSRLNNNGVYDFYNDSAREYIDLTSANQSYHNVPISAKNVESVRDRVVFSNCVIGRDTIPVEYSLSVSYGEALDSSVTPIEASFIFNFDHSLPADPWPGHLIIHVPSVNQFDVLNFGASFNSTCRPEGGVEQAEFAIGLAMNFSEASTSAQVADRIISAIGDNISYRRRRVDWPNVPDVMGPVSQYVWLPWFTEEYTVAKSESAGLVTIELILKKAYCELPEASIYDAIRSDMGVHVDMDAWYGKSSKGKQTFKSYSYYNVGVSYYDKVGRTSGVLLGDNKRIYIPGGYERDAPDRGKVARISWSIGNQAPLWACYYRICVTESINVLSVFPFKSLPGGDITPATYVVEYDGKSVVAINCIGSGYEYVKGDYLLLEGSTNIIKPVLGYLSAISIDGSDVFGNFIIVPADVPDLSVYWDTLFYVHRHRDKIEDAVYYEDYITYTTSLGVHSVVDGIISCGDAWMMNRQYKGSGASSSEVVEDFVINTMYNIRSYSKGRPMISLKDFKESRQQIMMWGGTHFRDTNTTEIAAFNFTDQKQLDAKFGQIHGMLMVGEVLKLVQSNKETSIYVGKSVFTDAGGQVQLSQIDSLFGNVNSSDTDEGSEDKKTIISVGRSMYYWDQNSGVVVRSSPNGQVAISKNGMEQFFYNRKRDIDERIDSGLTYSVLFGHDPRHNEIIVTFSIGTYIETIVFDEDLNLWMFFADYYARIGGVSYAPDLICNSDNDVLSFLGGGLYTLESNNASNKLFNGNSAVEIIGVLNDSPAVEKLYKNMEVDCDGVYLVNTTTPKSSTAPFGMSTYSTPQNFRKERGKGYAPFLRNTTTSFGVDNNLIYSGREMQGRIAQLHIISTSPYSTQGNFEFRDMQVNWLAV